MAEENVTATETPQAEDTGKAPEAAAPSTDAAPAETQKTEVDQKAEAQKEEAESYDLKLPENSKLKPERLQAIAEEAKALKLSADVAQKLVDAESRAAAQVEQDQADLLKSEDVKWVNELKADKDFGGANYEKSVELSHRALKHYGGEDFFNMLQATGLGNHPGMVRAFHKIGLEMAEDQLVTSTVTGSGDDDVRDVLFPTMKKK